MKNLYWSFNFEKVDELTREYLNWRGIGPKVDIISFKDHVIKILPGNIKINTLIDSHGSPEFHFINQNQEGFYLKIWRSRLLCCFIVNFDYRHRIIHLDQIDIFSFAEFSKAYFHLLDERVTNDDWIIDNQKFSESKEEENRNFAEKSIEISLQSIMKNIDCEYFIEKNSSGIALNVKLNRKRIAKTINKIHLIDEESGLLTTVVNYNNFEKWKKADNHGS
jgi:hypothetical protein